MTRNLVVVFFGILLATFSAACQCAEVSGGGSSSATDSDQDDDSSRDVGSALGAYNFPRGPTDEELHRVIGGEPGLTGTAIANGTNGEIYIASIIGRALTIYTLNETGVTAIEVAPFASDSTLSVDKQGHLHTVYFNTWTKEIVYSTNISGVFQEEIIEKLDESVFDPYCDLVLDDEGDAHVVYWGLPIHFYNDLRYANKKDGKWYVESVKLPTLMGGRQFPPTIAVDGYNNVHISFWDDGILYLSNVSGEWLSEELIVNNFDCSKSLNFQAGMRLPIEVDENGIVHLIVFTYDSSADYLYHARKNGGTWNFDLVDSSQIGLGYFVSMKLDESGNLHLAYPEYYLTPPEITINNFYYSTNRSGTWEKQSILDQTGSEGIFPSITLDKNDAVEISFYDVIVEGLKYLTNKNGTWQENIVDIDHDPWKFFDATTDKDGFAHVYIMFHNSSEENWTAKHYCNVDGKWSTETIFLPTNQDFIYSLDREGRLHLVVSNTSTHQLEYMNNVSGAWVTENFAVINDNDYLTEAMIKIDPNGFAHVVYGKESNNTLNYASNHSGEWLVETILSGEIHWIDFEVDQWGSVHLLYSDGDYDNLSLIYTDNTGKIWKNPSTIDTGVDTGGAAITLDSDRHSHVTYFKPSGEVGPGYAQMYATNKNGIWRNEVVHIGPSADQNGGTSGISVDNNEVCHVIYNRSQQSTYNAHEYLVNATNASGVWVSSNLDAAGDVGYKPLILFNNGMLHAFYYGEHAIWYNRFKP